MHNLTHYIANPATLSFAEIDALDTLCKKFPYFQSAHILLARAGKNDNAFSYNKHLKMAGLYAGDRRILYEFMHRQVIEQPEISLHPNQDNNSDISSNEKPVNTPLTINYPFTSEDERLPKLEPKAHQPIFRLIAEPEPKNESKIEEPISAEFEQNSELQEPSALRFEPEFTSDNHPNQEEIIEIREEAEPVLDIQEQIESELIINESLALDEIEEKIVEPEVEDFNVQELNNSEIEEKEEIETPDLVPEPDALSIQEIPLESLPTLIEEVKAENKDLDFFSWLDTVVPTTQPEVESPIIKKEISEQSPEIIEEALEAIHQISETEDEVDEYAPSDWAEIAYDIQAFVKSAEPIESKKTPEKPSKSDIDSLLDRFIQKNPSISKPKAEIYKPENMAKKSEEFHSDIASETLANLFYKQGLLHRSLEIYEKLMLQKPEKKEIFATRIKKIKEELINRL